jgi:hypothetical protein
MGYIDEKRPRLTGRKSVTILCCPADQFGVARSRGGRGSMSDESGRFDVQ